MFKGFKTRFALVQTLRWLLRSVGAQASRARNKGFKTLRWFKEFKTLRWFKSVILFPFGCKNNKKKETTKIILHFCSRLCIQMG